MAYITLSVGFVLLWLFASIFILVVVVAVCSKKMMQDLNRTGYMDKSSIN